MTSVLGFFLVYNFYILIILITGFIFKKIFWNIKEDNLTLGEIGIFGFVFIYLFVTVFHFFLPINIYFSLVFYFLCIIFFLFEFKNISALSVKYCVLSKIKLFSKILLFFKTLS